MKKLFLTFMILTSFLGFMGCKSSTDPATWSSDKIDDWFAGGKWLNGLNISPDGSINKRELAVSYYKNKDRWDKAFTFLKENDLAALEAKRYDIDGDNLFATVSEYTTKNIEDANFEAHRKYIDIQYVISGVEQIGVAPVLDRKEVVTPYDATKDIEFMTVTQSKNYLATPERFFIFFPTDAHCPGLKVDENLQVKKVVIKVMVE